MGLLSYKTAEFPNNFDPLDFDSLHRCTPKKANNFFHWHQEILQDRVYYLLNFCSQCSGVPYEKLHSFPHGTLPLWHWFLETAEVVPLSLAEKEAMYKKLVPQMTDHPAKVVSDIVSDLIPDNVMAPETEKLLWDIAMYVGDGFTRLSPKLHWELFRDGKSDVSYNHPVVRGFTPPGIIPGRTLWIDPISLVRVQALHFVKGSGTAHDLQDIIMEWMVGV